MINSFLSAQFAADDSANSGDYYSPEFDDLLAQADAAATTTEAIDFYHRAEEILFRELPAIPLWTYSTIGGYSDKVSNVEFGWDSVPLYYNIVKN